MALVKAYITFSLPEDMHSDLLVVSESQNRNHGYLEYQSLEYRYGTTKVELEIDDTRWYRLQFHNTKESKAGPVSEPVYGGNFRHGSPFLAVSTTTDGANYATVEDVYDYSGLTSADVPQERISNALRRARAVIDWRTAEMDLDRLDIEETDIRRRKYNAALRILKEAEINLALGNVYQNMADDVIIENRREGDYIASGGTAIGGTSVGGDQLHQRTDNIQFLNTVADRYFMTAERLLSTIAANTIRLTGSDYGLRMPKFTHPFSTRRGTLRYAHWW